VTRKPRPSAIPNHLRVRSGHFSPHVLGAVLGAENMTTRPGAHFGTLWRSPFIVVPIHLRSPPFRSPSAGGAFQRQPSWIVDIYGVRGWPLRFRRRHALGPPFHAGNNTPHSNFHRARRCKTSCHFRLFRPSIPWIFKRLRILVCGPLSLSMFE
jgi:hypothetical protein